MSRFASFPRSVSLFVDSSRLGAKKPAPRRLIAVLLVAIALLLVPVLAACGSSGEAISGSIQDLGVAPGFKIETFDGQEISLDELRGKPVVVNFWASWCPPCRQEAKDLERTWQAYKDKGVVFVGIAENDTEADSKEFIKEFGITYANGPDSTGQIGKAYGITGIPETFLISKEGRLMKRYIGPVSRDVLGGGIEILLLR
ncbi:MAG: TlpA family protein disulfide reductase [Chloroflexi bacterium]|nr:TlpA family protein disulfide reductase [Chloroflexota bacterium]